MCEYWQAGDHVEAEKTQCSAVNGKRGTVSVCHLSARDEEMNVKPNPELIQDASLLIPSFTITAHSHVRPHIMLPKMLGNEHFIQAFTYFKSWLLLLMVWWMVWSMIHWYIVKITFLYHDWTDVVCDNWEFVSKDNTRDVQKKTLTESEESRDNLEINNQRNSDTLSEMRVTGDEWSCLNTFLVSPEKTKCRLFHHKYKIQFWLLV